MAKQTKTRRSAAELLEADQVRTKRLAAKLEQRQIKAALSYYAAADKGRRNKDFRAPPSSADLAIIPDAPTVNARARMMVANTWIGKAAKRAQVRNVVGRGIMVEPVAKGPDGKELEQANLIASRLWMKWASDFKSCDIEKKRTFWQTQRVVASEEFITGIGLLAWSYQPNPFNVGLRLQVFEYEQLDNTIQSHDGNEVRGGVEVDENGAAVAYHFYPKNPNDYAYSGNSYKSERVPADRILAYFDAERAHQTLAISHLAPVMQDIRDTARAKDANLMRAVMEACVGFAIKKNLPTTGGAPYTMPRAAGDTGVTASGARTTDFMPGMVIELQPGEELQSYIPTTPGDGYESFTTLNLRGIGAGMGFSLGALTRHNDANYSAARQDMLEDEREVGPQQDALIDHIIMPVYELFYSMAVMEGRLPIDPHEFLADRDRFIEAEYIPPARPWIDPQKEADAYRSALEDRIITRKEIIAMRGGRFQNVMRQIAAERDDASKNDITFPEDAPKQLPAPVAEPKDEPKTGELARLSLSVLDSPPKYRPATATESNCGVCRFLASGKCTAYGSAEVGEYFLCDSFEPSTKARASLPPPQDGAGIDANAIRDIV